MSTANAKKVILLAMSSMTFRTAFKADPAQALSLFSADLHLSDDNELTQQQIDGIASLTAEQYEAFGHILSIVGETSYVLRDNLDRMVAY